jgi:hypothetical protein
VSSSSIEKVAFHLATVLFTQYAKGRDFPKDKMGNRWNDRDTKRNFSTHILATTCFKVIFLSVTKSYFKDLILHPPFTCMVRLNLSEKVVEEMKNQ